MPIQQLVTKVLEFLRHFVESLALDGELRRESVEHRGCHEAVAAGRVDQIDQHARVFPWRCA